MELVYEAGRDHCLDRFVYVFSARAGRKQVKVEISEEAMEDYGERKAKKKAGEKYAKGELQPDGSILVVTRDFVTHELGPRHRILVPGW